MTKPIDQMSAAELKQLAAAKEKEERARLDAKKKQYTAKRDNFILATVTEMCQLSETLHSLKKKTLTEGNDLHDQMYEIFEKEPKELKRFSLITEDSNHKLEIEKSEVQALNETAEVAITEIRDILRDKFANRNKAMYGVIDSLLSKNRKGDYDPRMVAKLRKHESDVNDERFSKALDTLSAAYYVSDTAMYVRAYKKDQRGKYQPINIQFSSL